jgi:hypothetical protein
MDTKPNTRTLRKHRGLPHMSDGAEQAALPGNPRICVGEAPARNQLRPSRSRHTV